MYYGSWLSWLDRYTDVIQHFIATQLILSPLLLLFIEEMGIPIVMPGDAVLAYVGYKLSLHQNASEFWLAFIMAMISIMAGSTILFFASRRWGQFILDKVARFVFIKEKQVHRVERMFVKYDFWAIIIGRHIPGLRIIVTILAGTSGVRYSTFAISTLISATAWVLIFMSIGKRLGADFHGLIQHYIGLSLAVTVAVVAGVIILHIIGLYHETKDAPTQPVTH
jgi:membrane protein DedA with SNARE-associated domain